MRDGYGREIDYLRISVTDRCNLRCVYCMPEEGVCTLPHERILRYEEILRLAKLFADMGFHKIRLTGGEPLVRRDVSKLIAGLKAIDGIEQVVMTTNAMALSAQLEELVAAGLDGVNISLDAVDEDVFRRITRFSGAAVVLAAIDEALRYPQLTVKVNCVPSGLNDDQLVPLAALAKSRPIAVRYIEPMPIGLGDTVMERSEAFVRGLLEQAFGKLKELQTQETFHGPCRYFTADGFVGKLGFISAISHKFCQSCNRVRLSADGFLKTCLQYDCGVDLRPLLAGEDDTVLREAIVRAIHKKPECHHFHDGTVSAERETKMMSQIGG